MTDWNAPILIVDGDAEARAPAAHVLARAGLPVLELDSGEAALEAALEQPAAVVLEVTLPDVDGFEVCRALRERHGDELPVIFVSGERTTAHDRVAGLLLGADDYLVKPVNGDELLVRVRRLLARAHSRGTAETRRADSLSPRELQILRLLAEGHSAAAIAERLVISHKTVASHLQRVMGKLGVHNRAQAVAQAYRLGLAGGLGNETPPLSAAP